MTFTARLSWWSKGRNMSQHIKIKKGLDLCPGGKPEQVIHDGPEIQHVALIGRDYNGLKPRLLVSEGEEVAHGQPLFIDKRDPGVSYCSPGQGFVSAINRGPRRVLDSVVVRLKEPGSDKISIEPLSSSQSATINRGQVIERLQKFGLWTAFRTRPFSRVPISDSSPTAIFVTAIDTRPLAADPAVVARADSEAFIAGLRLLPLLTEGKVFLCTGQDWDIEIPAVGRLETITFSGPHPAGLPGTHIHHLYPAGLGRVAWQIDYQDVIASGKLRYKGRLST